MACYLVVNARITDPEGLIAYSKAARGAGVGHPVKAVVVTNDAETLEGEPVGSRVVILEFPDKAALRAWYDSPEYQAVVGMRFAATEGFAVIAEGL
jgi:uncharacterized protein (DUF1330 family)